MGLYTEREWNKWTLVLLLVFACLLIYLPWVLSARELFRDESIYAVAAMEFDPSGFSVTAHGVPVHNVSPLFPAVTALLAKLFHLPIELIMRFLSVFMLAAGAVLVYFAAAAQRTSRAGFTAAAFYLSTPGCKPHTCAIIIVRRAYEAILNGTPRNTSALRWYSWQESFPSAT